MITTIETRLKLDKIQEDQIDSCVEIWSVFYRKTWVLWNNLHQSEKEIYDALMQTKLLTSYQVDSLINKVKTEHSKIKELTKYQVKLQQQKLEALTLFIKKESVKIERLQKERLKLQGTLQGGAQRNYSAIATIQNRIKKSLFVLNAKTRKTKRILRSIAVLQERIKKDTFKLCFGSTGLFKQQPGHPADRFRTKQEQKVYDSKEQWKADWKLARNNIWYSVGKALKPQGNAEIQYYPETDLLRIRVTEKEYVNRLGLIAQKEHLDVNELADMTLTKFGSYRIQARFMLIENVSFCNKNELKLIHALNNKQPITAKIMKKRCPDGKTIGFYLQLSFKEIPLPVLLPSPIPALLPNANAIIPAIPATIPNPIKNAIKNRVPSPSAVIDTIKKSKKTDSLISSQSYLTMGVDLNQKGIAYCIVKKDGNKLQSINGQNGQSKPHGFLSWSLEKKTTQQRQWIISTTLTSLLKIAQEYRINTIAIENLDFGSIINDMNSGYKQKQKYNAMLTQFAKTQFSDMMQRKTARFHIALHLVNPSYSSIGGFAKYGLLNKVPVDIAASHWLARQSIFGTTYKQEEHKEYKKSYKEPTAFPYSQRKKQSKTALSLKRKWKEVGSALGSDRRLWYKNIMIFIRPKVDPSLSKVQEDLCV